MPVRARSLLSAYLLAASLYVAFITGATAALEFPVLFNLNSISLPESASDIATPFSIIRPPEVAGAFHASISCFAAYPFDRNNSVPRPPLEYRFSPAGAWTPVNGAWIGAPL